MCDSYCKFQNIPLFGLILHNLFNHMVALLNQLTSDRTLDVFAENPIYASEEENVSYHITSILEVIHCVHIGQTCPDVFWNSHCFLAFVFVWLLTKMYFAFCMFLKLNFFVRHHQIYPQLWNRINKVGFRIQQKISRLDEHQTKTTNSDKSQLSSAKVQPSLGRMAIPNRMNFRENS